MLALIKWLVGHRTTVLLTTICVFLFGTYSYVTLPRESSPDITIPVVLVSTPYQGVSPEDIESLISIPMENELASLRDIKELKSSSIEGVSIVSVEFEPDVIIEDALQRVRDRVSRVRPSLPSDVEESSVREISFSDIPVLLLTIAGEVDEEVLKGLAETLMEDLTRIPGVLDAKLSGGVTREIRVEVLPERIAHYGLSLEDVLGAIANENVNIPGGNVDNGRGNFLLRVPGEFTKPSQIETVAIKRVGDKPVFVRDIARVVDGYSDRETYSRMGGQPSVTLSVTKRTGANILKVASDVKDTAAAHNQDWPSGVHYRVLGDESKYIQQSVTDLQNNIITALLLVVAVIITFMGLRNSLFVALAIPLSMLLSMLVIQALGFTLNMVVLFSLMLALGMLVDNGIVVVENIYRHAELGADPVTASIEGTREVAVAVAASTATTVAAFSPLVFWTGIMGEFMGFLPKTVIIVLVSSLVVAIGVLPVAMSRWMPRPPALPEGQEHVRKLGPMMSRYKRVLEFSIRWRYLTAGAGVFALLFTSVVYGLLNHGTEFFPATQPDRAIVGIRLPQGAALDTTDRVVRSVEQMLAEEQNTDIWVAESGVSAAGDALSGINAAPYEARITLDFKPDRNNAMKGEAIRAGSSHVSVTALREAVGLIPGARVTVEPAAMGPPVGKAIEVHVTSENFDDAGQFAEKLIRELGKVRGITDLEDDYNVGRPELRLRVDRGAAKRVGVSTATVGNSVRTAIAGSKASTLRNGDDEHDIVVSLGPSYKEDLQAVLNLRLPGREDTSPDTYAVPLSSVASFELVGGSGAIRHIDQDLVVTVTGDVMHGHNANDVQAEIKELLAAYDTPPGIHLSMAGSDDEQQESMEFLTRAFFIAVALIMMVLVTQFDSLAMPLIILATVVLSLVGVMWGLLITGTPFGVIMTGLGVISLAGVVVNNAIVLLDYVQQLRERGMEVHDALVEAGLTRFRPVMLTAITTTLGLAPMAIGVSIDFTRMRLVIGSTSAQWWGPMAVAVIFGLSFATVLTLIMVPTLYSIVDELQGVFSGSRRKAAARAATTTAVAALVLLFPGSAKSVTLEEAWQAAEDNNPTLQLQREVAIQTGTLRGKAYSTLSPRVDASATYVINSREIAFDPTENIPPDVIDLIGVETEPMVVQQKTFWQGEVGVSQRLFNGTAVPLLNSAYQLTNAANSDVSTTRQQIRAGVAQTYYGLLTAQEGVAVAEIGVQTAEHQLELATRQREAGLVTERATLQARLQLAQAKRDLANATAARVEAEEAFAVQTGLRDTDLTPPAMLELPATMEEAIATAKDGRADIRAAHYRSDALFYQRAAKDLQWLPVVDGRAAYFYDENTGFADDPFFWRVSAKATWLLWDGGLRLAERREIASQIRANRLQERVMTNRAEEQIRVAWHNHQTATAAVASVEEELELARQNVALAERSFEAGQATWLDVEQAQLGLRSAEFNRLSERMNQYLAAVQIRIAAGTL